MKDDFENEEENMEHKNKLERCLCLPVQRLVDLNLGSGSAGPFTVTTGTLFTLSTAVNVVSVPVNADECRIDPCLRENCCRGELRVLLTFIADISINALALGTTLNFYLVRSSCNSTVLLGPFSTFTLTLNLGTLLTVGHAFEYLDKDIEPGDYTYSVQIAPGSSVTGAVTLGASVLVQSATLSAVAAFV